MFIRFVCDTYKLNKPQAPKLNRQCPTAKAQFLPSLIRLIVIGLFHPFFRLGAILSFLCDCVVIQLDWVLVILREVDVLIM